MYLLFCFVFVLMFIKSTFLLTFVSLRHFQLKTFSVFCIFPLKRFADFCKSYFKEKKTISINVNLNYESDYSKIG